MSDDQTIRGGGWSNNIFSIPSADRYFHLPISCFNFLGFRIAKHTDQAKATRGGSWRSISSGHIFGSAHPGSGCPSTSHIARGFRVGRRKV